MKRKVKRRIKLKEPGPEDYYQDLVKVIIEGSDQLPQSSPAPFLEITSPAEALWTHLPSIKEHK